jgi:para-aminobenzoate synthetase component 1
MRRTLKFHTARESFKKRLLSASRSFSRFALLDSNDHLPGRYAFIAAAGKVKDTNDLRGNMMDKLESICKEKDWLFGHIAYDVKNEIEQLHSDNHDGVHFPELCFFVPQYVFVMENDELTVHYHASIDEKEAKHTIDRILNSEEDQHEKYVPADIKSRIKRDHYIAQVEKIKQHIRLGDIYEMNFCQEFYAEHAAIDPVHVFNDLDSISRAPFSAYYRLDDHHLLCASPERFISKQGALIISQPIKGTARRGKDGDEDENLKKELAASEKERSENVMIVDLVRNDLSRIAKRGSVKVDELFGIYTFRQVHQMISTVSAELRDEISFTGIIRATFPMGSMTGAPKVRAMQLIEQYESSKRGVYSGTVGYIDPEGNFDLNVVIRSIVYNASSKYLSFTVGSAITGKSDPASEYEECLVKAAAMLKVLKGKVHA